MKRLQAACGAEFLVDDDVWEWARHEKWHLKNGYPARYVRGSKHGAKDSFELTLHRELLHMPAAHVHHKDGDPLNCRRDNLEVLSISAHFAVHNRSQKIQAAIRKAAPRSKSGFKGVSFRPRLGRWVAQFCADGRNRTIGSAATAEEAALLYDAAVLAFAPGSYTNLVP